MKVLVVGSKYAPEYAGSGTRIHNTYKRLVARYGDIDWQVICNSVEFPGNEDYVYEGVPVQRISSRLFSGWEGLPRPVAKRIFRAAKTYAEALPTFRLMARERYDLLHVFGTSASTIAAIAWARWKNIPLIIELVTVRANPFHTLPGLRYAELMQLDKQTVVIAISADLGKTCARLGLTQNIWLRPNPVDARRFFPSFERKSHLRAQITPFSDTDCVLTAVAKFTPQKNQVFLLDVLEHLPERYKLVLAGPVVSGGPLLARDRDYLSRIRARIDELGLESRVFLRTEFVNIADYVKLSDVYMLSNTAEGHGTPMLESLACGVPVVANRGEGSFREWIRDGRNGFLRDLTPEAWAQAIRKAENFSPAHMEAVAKEVLDVASTDVIDEKYYTILKALTVLEPGEILDVAAILEKRTQ